MSVRSEIDAAKDKRVVLYWLFIATSILVLGAVIYLWNVGVEFTGGGQEWRDAHWLNPVLWKIAEALRSVLPQLFDNFIIFAVLKFPILLAGLIGVVVLYYPMRTIFRNQSDNACEKARRYILKQMGRTY